MQQFKPFSQFINQKLPQLPDQISMGLLKAGYLMEIYGLTSTYKTWLAMDLALSLTSGTNWLCWATQPTKVTIINSEMSEQQYQERWLDKLLQDKRIPLPDSLSFNCNQIQLDTLEGGSAILNWIGQSKSTVLIVDNLFTSLTGDLLRGNELLKFRVNLLTILRMGCSIVLIHHNRQTQFSNNRPIKLGVYEGYGMSFLPNMLDTAIGLEIGEDNVIKLEVSKHRLAKYPPIATQWRFENLQFKLDC